MKKAGLGLLYIIIGAYLAISAAAPYAYGQAVTAMLDKVKGSVQIKDASGQWKNAAEGAPLNIGDYIKTGGKSEAVIVITNLDEKVKIRIMENTQTSLRDIMVNSLTGKQDSTILLGDGSIGVASNEFHMNTAFKAETPNAIVEMGRYGVTIKYKEGAGR